MIFVITIINNVNNNVRMKIIGHYSLLGIQRLCKRKCTNKKMENQELGTILFFNKTG